MPKMKIPCDDCESQKEQIEEAGDQEVVSCGPIDGELGWCEIVWRRRGATRALAKPAKRSSVVKPRVTRGEAKKKVKKGAKKQNGRSK
jgi:hypothetical protein